MGFLLLVITIRNLVTLPVALEVIWLCKTADVNKNLALSHFNKIKLDWLKIKALAKKHDFVSIPLGNTSKEFCQSR